MNANGSLNHPAGVIDRLEAIEGELATTQNEYEAAAREWFRMRRDRAHAEAQAYVRAEGTDTARRLAGKAAGMEVGWEQEGRYDILKRKLQTLGDRATIGQSLLRAQSRI